MLLRYAQNFQLGRVHLCCFLMECLYDYTAYRSKVQIRYQIHTHFPVTLNGIFSIAINGTPTNVLVCTGKTNPSYLLVLARNQLIRIRTNSFFCFERFLKPEQNFFYDVDTFWAEGYGHLIIVRFPNIPFQISSHSVTVIVISLLLGSVSTSF